MWFSTNKHHCHTIHNNVTSVKAYPLYENANFCFQLCIIWLAHVISPCFPGFFLSFCCFVQDEQSSVAMLKKHQILEQAVEDYAETVHQLSKTSRALVAAGHPERWGFGYYEQSGVNDGKMINSKKRVQVTFDFVTDALLRLVSWCFSTGLKESFIWNMLRPKSISSSFTSERIGMRQCQVDKLYAGLKDLSEERRGKLDERSCLFQLNREVDDLEQWIAEREVVAGSHELGQDYEHVTVRLLTFILPLSFVIFTMGIISEAVCKVITIWIREKRCSPF